MQALRFGFPDLFRAPRLAFSLQRMWIQFLGMGAGYLFYLIFTYIGYLSCGFSLASIWSRFGLLPCLFACSDGVSWAGWLFYGLGSMGLFVAFLLTNTAVARAAYMAMKGHPFYSWREAFSFACRKWASVVIAPLSLFTLIGMVLIAGFLVGLFGKIPYIGALGLSLATLFWFLAALFLLYFLLVALVSIWLAPSIIATSDEDAFEVVFQSFSLTWSQPWRVLGYQVLALLLAVFSLMILAAMGKAAVLIMNAVLAVAMGNEYSTLAYGGQALLQNALSASHEFFEFALGSLTRFFYFSKQYSYPDFTGMSTTVAISSWIYAGSLLFVMGWVLAFGFSTYTIGNVLSYLSLRKRKDGENLLERHDREEDMEESEEENPADGQKVGLSQSA